MLGVAKTYSLSFKGISLINRLHVIWQVIIGGEIAFVGVARNISPVEIDRSNLS